VVPRKNYVMLHTCVPEAPPSGDRRKVILFLHRTTAENSSNNFSLFNFIIWHGSTSQMKYHYVTVAFKILSLIWHTVNITAITSFEVIQGHRCWYQTKADIGLPYPTVSHT